MTITPTVIPAAKASRLVRLAHIWAVVRYQHPWIASRDIDWDRPLLGAISKVCAATSDDHCVDAIAEMLASLGDPATRIAPIPGGAVPQPARELVSLLDWSGSIAILRVGLFAAAHGVNALSIALATLSGLERARGVVVDLRFPQAIADALEAVRHTVDEVLRVPTQGLEIPGRRYVQHSGYRPQRGASSGGYFSGFLTLPATVREPAYGSPSGPVIFVTGPSPRVPLLACALRSAGDAAIVAEESFGEEAVVDVQPVTVGSGAVAQVRLSELIPTIGWRGVAADVVVSPEAGGDVALQTAIELAGRGRDTLPRPAVSPALVLPDARWRPDKPYAEMVAPDLEHRMLAAFRVWSIIDRFYPYKYLSDDWDTVLAEFIPHFEVAATADAYALAVMEMSARIEDGHTRAYGHPSLPRLFGEASIPIAVRWIERQFVVTSLLDPSASEAGIKLGDVVEAIDEEPMVERVSRLRKYFTASTETARMVRVAGQALRGPKDVPAKLALRRPDRSLHTINIPRLERLNPKPPNGEIFRLLDQDIGYVDLTRLVGQEVDRMFEALGQTKAIIFDMRGYPNGTAWQIAPRINIKGAKTAATFRRPQWMGNVSEEMMSTAIVFEQKIPERVESLYTGKTFMLIDERTISQAEHSGLFFEAANDTEFIGTPSAGANGDVTNFTLPGGFIVSFTGHDVRHADGRQLQRLGLIPHLVAEPSILGISQDRDEVCERAVVYVRNAISSIGQVTP